MARKLELAVDPAKGTESRLGRREYVKFGAMSMVMGGAVVGLPSRATATGDTSVRIEGTGSLTSYELTVTKSLVDDPTVEFDAAGNISGTNAEGTVRDGAHGYRFDGELVDVRLYGDGRVYVDGTRQDPSRRSP